MVSSAVLPGAVQAAAISTVTTLNISTSTVASPAPITLTATVTAGGSPVAEGTVIFCDASATFCEDAAIVGRAQLNGGNAQYKFIPGIGSHTYKAIFVATTVDAGSTSSPQTVTSTGLYQTATSIAASGDPAGYQLTATVVGYANHPPVLAGTVSFQDTSAGNFVLGTAPLGTPTYTQGFAQATNSPIQSGNQPSATGTADFNGDGKPDVAVMDSYQNAITILLNNGNGTFTTGQFITGVGSTPCIYGDQPSNCSMAVGDFNHDGKADLAETSGGDNAVYVLLGNGDGTFAFAPGSPVTVGSFPQAVRIGDFNRDGLLDMAVANGYDNTVSIMLGNGDGTFTQANSSPIAVGAFPFFLAVSDFNGDGNPDVAVTNDEDSTVSILLGNGDGTFTNANGSPVFSGNYAPGPVTAADFNSDGIPDLAIANFIPDTGATNSNIVLMLGKGDGTFTNAPGSPIIVGLYPFALAAADFNQDGKLDLAVDNYGLITDPSTQTLELLLGNGQGGFTAAGTPTQLGDSPNDLAAADYNGDGVTDLAIPNIADFSTSIFLYQFTQTATASVSNITVAGTATHYVDAVYEGNTSFATSTSGTVPLLGRQVATTLTLTANPTQQMITMPVTFTATLAAANTNEPLFTAPTGIVTFYDQSLSQTIGTAPMGPNGQAVFTTSSILWGNHVITASYAGDPTFLPSNSGNVTIAICDLMIARVGHNNTTILPGTTVNYSLEVTPQVVNTFLYTVSFTATGLPAGATATFSPATLAAGAATSKITMTVETVKTAANVPPAPFGRLPLALGLLLPLFGARGVRKRLRQLPSFLAVMLVAGLSLAAMVGLSGCGGAGFFAAKKIPYSITVTATEGTVQRSTQVPLTIQ